MPAPCRAAPRRIAACLSLLLASCGQDSKQNHAPPPADAGHDAPQPHPLPPIPSCSPTFESIRTNIIVPTCALPLCHIGTDSFLELVPGEPEKMLIGVPANCGDWMRVVPGDPERSYLWHKLTRDRPDCGDRMPWGYERLPDKALDCIRDWILGL